MRLPGSAGMSNAGKMFAPARGGTDEDSAAPVGREHDEAALAVSAARFGASLQEEAHPGAAYSRERNNCEDFAKDLSVFGCADG